MTDQPAAPTPIDDDAAESLVAAYDEAGEKEPEARAARIMTDEFLLRAHQRTKRGSQEAIALRAEIIRRGLSL